MSDDTTGIASSAIKELDDAFTMLSLHLADAIHGFANRKRADELLIDLRIAVEGRIAAVRVEEIQAAARNTGAWQRAIEASPAIEPNPVCPGCDDLACCHGFDIPVGGEG